jgi:co-chaperonin GroES (HSP10)
MSENKTLVRPTEDRLLVRMEGGEQKAGSIILPDSAIGGRWAVVVDVGPGRRTEHGAVLEPRRQVGERVMLHENCNTQKIMVDGVAHLLVREVDVVAFEE